MKSCFSSSIFSILDCIFSFLKNVTLFLGSCSVKSCTLELLLLFFRLFAAALRGKSLESGPRMDYVSVIQMPVETSEPIPTKAHHSDFWALRAEFESLHGEQIDDISLKSEALSVNSSMFMKAESNSGRLVFGCS